MAEASKLPLRVRFASSETPEYSATQLDNVGPTTRGWQSAPNCSYPQELIFEIITPAGSSPPHLTQLQLLSHQSKIATRVEIYVADTYPIGRTNASPARSGLSPRGVSSDLSQLPFRHLGYISLDSNERSGYRARELRTIHLDTPVRYLRLVFPDAHDNQRNPDRQVGIVGVNCLGFAPLSEDDLEESLPGVSPGYLAPSDPSAYSQMGIPQVPPNRRHGMGNPYNDLGSALSIDPQTAEYLRQLADAKSRTVASEDYEKAKQIKVVEHELRELGIQMAQLELAKQAAVDAEDYDAAKDLKTQAVALRKQINTKIREVNIPGLVADVPKIPLFAPERNSPAREWGSTVEEKSDDYGGPFLTSARPESADQDRPIRPKNNPYYHDHDPVVEDGSSLDTNQAPETFPPGEHPLEGTPNLDQLPTPELLAVLSREFCEQSGILKLCGEYRARCLFSKAWTLREAVFRKLRVLTETDYSVDLQENLPALCAILRVGSEDRTQQILSAMLPLLETVMNLVTNAKLPRATVAPMCEPILTRLIDKLAEGNSRIRDGARRGLVLMADCPAVGPAVVTAHVSRQLPPKQRSNWRPIAARLALLTDIVKRYNVAHGLTIDTLLALPLSVGAFTHSTREVRDAAKDLVVAIHVATGEPLQNILRQDADGGVILRRAQMEDYLAAFNNATGQTSSNTSPVKGGVTNNETPTKKSPSKRTDPNQQHAPQNPAGRVPTSSYRASQGDVSPRLTAAAVAADVGESADYTSCMFCNQHDVNWTEADMDLHFWKECPFLLACPSCAQIVEIAGLPEHLLDECESRNEYVPCEVTGLAIRRSEFTEWSASPACVPAPTNSIYCPLCHSAVEDSDNAWSEHLSRHCPKNPRITVE